MPRVTVSYNVEDDDKQYKQIRKAIKSLRPLLLKVGWFDSENAAKALFAEMGSDDTPARPFFTATIDENREKYWRLLQRMLEDVADGKGGNYRQAFARLGRIIVADVKANALNGPWAPNDPDTAEEKGSTKPLVDTGAMLRALRSRVEGREAAPESAGGEQGTGEGDAG